MVVSLDLNGKKYDMTVGIGLLADLNEKYGGRILNRNVGSSVGTIYLELQAMNPVIVFDMIKLGTQRNIERPSDEEIEKYIFDNMETEEGALKMFDNFFEYFKTLPGSNLMIKEMNLDLGLLPKSSETKVEKPKKTRAKKTSSEQPLETVSGI